MAEVCVRRLEESGIGSCDAGIVGVSSEGFLGDG